MRDNFISTIHQRVKYVVADWITSSIAFLLFNICRCLLLTRGKLVWDYLFSDKLIIEQILIPPLMLAVYWLSGYYNIPFGKSRLQEMITTFFSALINAGLIYLVLLINDQSGRRLIDYELLLVLIGLLFIFPYLGRLLITENTRRHFRRHQWEFRVLVIGNTPKSRETGRKLMEEPSRVGYHIVGYVNIPGENSIADDGVAMFSFDDVAEVCRREDVDQIIVAPEVYEENTVLQILYTLYHLDLPVKIAPDIYSYVTSGIRLKDIYGEPFVDLTTPAMSESAKNVKRFGDVIVSGMVLLLFSPLYALIALLVKRSSPGPVIYSQERIGLKQRPFRIYKFRTMRTDAEAAGPQLSAENDPRITPIGKILRKYRLDEIPQFWNVLKGEMSIVGPRPERAYYIRQIMERAPYYALVYQVRPGITSWGMVKYGYASTVSQMVERTRYDLIYMSNMSLFVDMKILIYTVKTVVTGRGL
jgi:exopolysaccharide biosynthesis polyprenyl glycosylphosphotransferase